MKRKFWLGLAACGLSLGLLVVLARLPGGASETRDAASPQTARALVPLEVGEMIYDSSLAKGWDDWGWGLHQLGNGPAKVVFKGYGGILLHHAELTSAYGGVAFRYRAPKSFGEFLVVALRGAGEPDEAYPLVSVEPKHVAALPDGWAEVVIDWQALNPKGLAFDRVMIGTKTMVADDWVLLDKIMLTKPIAGAAVAAGGALRVLCDRDVLPISPLIYGGSRDNWESGQSAQRLGGNPLTRANWELGVWNVGKDWFFENQSQKTTVFQDIELAAKQQRQLAVVVPMIGWVARDGTSSSFPRTQFPAQAAFDPHRPEAGNGVAPDGKLISPPPPTTTSVDAPPERIGAWIKKVATSEAGRAGRPVHMYILDNEPSLWNVTHRDVHPEPLSYDELLDRTIKYASVIRASDPQALIAGPAEWGWLGYQSSAVDREAGGGRQPDRQAHGGLPLVAWYLQKLAEHERSTGQRLLDVLDLHFYPAAEGIYDGHKTDSASNELRLRSTRALWDPSYRDESWINEQIRLIPRMKDWVRDNYPGRKLMIGEWSFGAEDHISGGMAAVEALGRFGQQGLYAAFFWGELKPQQPVFWAFRAFRDFDGKGGRFRDLSVAVEEAQDISLFASRDLAMQRLTLVLVNRRQGGKMQAAIALRGCGRVTGSRLFSYRAGSTALAPAASTITPDGVSAELEPSSFAVIDLDVSR
jgi:hypothetical protein